MFRPDSNVVHSGLKRPETIVPVLGPKTHPKGVVTPTRDPITRKTKNIPLLFPPSFTVEQRDKIVKGFYPEVRSRTLEWNVSNVLGHSGRQNRDGETPYLGGLMILPSIFLPKTFVFFTAITLIVKGVQNITDPYV